MFETSKDSFAKREEKILSFWKKEKIFEQSVESKENQPLFSFYDGPPFATGLPHYGHLLAGTIKDVVPRYKTMHGFYVPRRFGWDCHGLPVENEIEKEYELYGARSIEQFGIDKFNEACASIVLRYTSEWKKTVERFGRWVDFSQTYRTMDKTFMESVWWVFAQLFSKGLVYEGFKVMPFSAKLGTPLSNFEANLNYKEVDDPSLVISFPLRDASNTFFLAWTTTPWTLVSNLALCVKEDFDYVMVHDKKRERYFILAKDRVSHFFKEDFSIVCEYKGKDLVGKKYVPLFPYFEKRTDAFRVISADFVTLEEGTGIVHTAPAFGEDDFYACQQAKIDIVCPVDNNGHFTEEVPPYWKMFVKDADKSIIRHLKEKGLVFSHGQIRHRYPFCWRSDTPLIYKAVNTWFIAVEKIKERLIAANQKIHWVPGHIKEGRFGKWLENARDWAVSRNRYWGTPIPIWKNAQNDMIVMSSVAELEKYTKKKIDNLHRHHIDDLSFEYKGAQYYRIPEVFDCWFESGSMPYAQNHYPFEHKKITEEGFPADFIAEGLDQTRGWFYTLNVLSTALFDQPAFKNVIVNGIILAEDGNKMSKRLKNYPEPTDIVDKYGADAIRLYMLNSPAMRADDLRFSSQGVELVVRQCLIPLWNSFYFLATYAKIYNWVPSEVSIVPVADIDRWILSRIEKLILDVEAAMDIYDLSAAVAPLVGFVNDLTNWYIRRNRERFWADEDTSDRREAFATLYEVLLRFVKIAAPFIPFITETIYSSLRTEVMPLSVHLCDYPQYNSERRNKELEIEMDYVQQAVSLGHSLRKETRIKVRQPLAKAYIGASHEIIAFLEQQKKLIADELNVREVLFERDETQFVDWVVKPNFPVLGRKYGKDLPKVQERIKHFTTEEMAKISQGESLHCSCEGKELVIAPEDVLIEKKIKEGLTAGHHQNITVVLETQLTEDLVEEGLAREIVNKLNTMRRDADFEVQDRICVLMQAPKVVQSCYEKYKEYIDHEVLAVSVKFKDCEGTSWDLNGHPVSIEIHKA
ncbi:MAG: isoleucine--tRNA ligase [Parachlamydiales bacterium]|nr:isoleucine--tRNA ligase [Parachlamydiales bacterium]